MPGRDIIVHILRTIVMCVVLAVLMMGLIAGCLWLRVPVWLLVTLLVVFVLAIVWGTARWHAYWAPIAKKVARIPWQRSDGIPMETVVEMAVVQAGSLGSESHTLRVSIYELELGPGGKPDLRRRRVKRVLVGDSAEFLGVYDLRLWFYIYDRFHACLDGLTCLDGRTGAWLYHRPQAELQFVDRIAKRRGVIESEEQRMRRQIDLASEPLDNPPYHD